jgi:phenylpyruvate tautomerase PptA (4-oxalocrotonate tautomerase family)
MTVVIVQRPDDGGQAQMPKIDLTYTADALSPEAKAKLPSQLANTLLKWEKAPDTDFFRSISWTNVHELPPDSSHDGNGPDTRPRFVIDVTTPEGALSDRRREEMTKEMTEQVLSAAGLDAEQDGLRVWVLMHEVAEGSWGAAGGIVRFEELRQAAREKREYSPAAAVEPAAAS